MVDLLIMTINYSKHLSNNAPLLVEAPAGLKADVKYIFSVTNTVPDCIDPTEYSKAAITAINDNSLSFGPYPPPQGFEPLRELLVGSLLKNRQITCDTEDIIITDGAGGALKMLVNAFIGSNDVVIAEDFTYLGTLKMLLEKGAEVVHSEIDEDGLIPEKLDQRISSLISENKKPKFILTIPVYQNPTGITLSLDRRHQLLKIAEKYEIPIIENESYADFRIDGPPLPPSIKSLDTKDLVIYISSFTKLLGCSLRVGFMVAPQGVLSNLEARRPSHLTVVTVYEYLKNNYENHAKKVQSLLKERRDRMVLELKKHLPEAEFTIPNGGMMLWVKMPEKINSWEILDDAVAHDVKYNPGGVFRSKRDQNNYFRLTYSHNNPDEISEGIKILASVFKKHLDS
jgi:2-aminoadipate transaminase